MSDRVQKDELEPAPSGAWTRFIVRTLIAVGIFWGGLLAATVYVINEVAAGGLRDRVRVTLKDEVTQFRVKGLLTTNPAVHWRVSQVQETRGNVRGALDEIELGLGLLELHSQDRAAKERFAARRDALRRQLEDEPKKSR